MATSTTQQTQHQLVMRLATGKLWGNWCNEFWPFT